MVRRKSLRRSKKIKKPDSPLESSDGSKKGLFGNKSSKKGLFGKKSPEEVSKESSKEPEKVSVKKSDVVEKKTKEKIGFSSIEKISKEEIKKPAIKSSSVNDLKLNVSSLVPKGKISLKNLSSGKKGNNIMYFKGKIFCDPPLDLYLGHILVIKYYEVADSLVVPREISTKISETGDFEAVFTHFDKLQDSFEIEVKEANGRIVALHNVTKSDLNNKEILLEIPKPSQFVLKDPEVPLKNTKKITGKVLDLFGKARVSSKQVLFWAKKDKDFYLIASTRTNSQGYFSCYVPVYKYQEAYLQVAVTNNPKVSIRLEEGIIPDKVLFAVEVPKIIDEEADQTLSIADSDDLTGSPESYANDLKPGVSFTTPNRTLEEADFYSLVRTSEPAIQGLTVEDQDADEDVVKKYFGDEYKPGYKIKFGVMKNLLKKLKKITFNEALKKNQLYTNKVLSNKLNVVKSIAGREQLTSKNSVDWDDEPTFYQATTIAHGFLLHYKQKWKAAGYSLGDLLYSLPLAPGQKKQIAILDWDRHEEAERDEDDIQSEKLEAQITRDRDVNEINAIALSESMKGASAGLTTGAAGGIGGVYNGAVVGISGGMGIGASAATQKAMRNMSAKALQQIKDTTSQAASSVRSKRSTVIQAVEQSEGLRAQTEVIANYNHCHAMTVQYFEVLRHMILTQELVDVRECVFVPLMISVFDRDKALRWKDILQRSILKRRLKRGFEANERIEQQYEGSDFPEKRYCDEVIDRFSGTISLEMDFSIPQIPKTEGDNGILQGKEWKFLEKIFKTPSPSLLEDLAIGTLENIRDNFEKNFASTIANKLFKRIEIGVLLDSGRIEKIHFDKVLLAERGRGTEKKLKIALRNGRLKKSVKRCEVEEVVVFSEEKDIPKKWNVFLKGLFVKYETKYISYQLLNASVTDDIASKDYAYISTPLSKAELRNPRKEDLELSTNLINHLNEHIEYFHKIIWWNMDDARRFMLLDGFIAPNSGGRSVASVVENRLIGIIGNSIILPVAQGVNLDPTFRQDVDNPVELIDFFKPEIPVAPSRISIPTPGVFAEAVLGSCNSCEFIDNRRFWKWEEHPIPDSPTGISRVSTESRREEPGNLQTKSFESPVVNIQNAPLLPDPANLNQAYESISKSNIFRDVTGLKQNQINAANAFNKAMEAAQAFGQMGLDLYKFSSKSDPSGKNSGVNGQQTEEVPDQPSDDPGVLPEKPKKVNLEPKNVDPGTIPEKPKKTEVKRIDLGEEVIYGDSGVESGMTPPKPEELDVVTSEYEKMDEKIKSDLIDVFKTLPKLNTPIGVLNFTKELAELVAGVLEKYAVPGNTIIQEVSYAFALTAWVYEGRTMPTSAPNDIFHSTNNKKAEEEKKLWRVTQMEFFKKIEFEVVAHGVNNIAAYQAYLREQLGMTGTEYCDMILESVASQYRVNVSGVIRSYKGKYHLH